MRKRALRLLAFPSGVLRKRRAQSEQLLQPNTPPRAKLTRGKGDRGGKRLLRPQELLEKELNSYMPQWQAGSKKGGETTKKQGHFQGKPRRCLFWVLRRFRRLLPYEPNMEGKPCVL